MTYTMKGTIRMLTECTHINKRQITRLSGPPLTICNLCGEHLSEMQGTSSILGGKEIKKEQNDDNGGHGAD